MTVSQLIAELRKYEGSIEIALQISDSRLSRIAGPHLVNLESLVPSDNGDFEWLEFAENSGLEVQDERFVCISHLEQSQWDNYEN